MPRGKRKEAESPAGQATVSTPPIEQEDKPFEVTPHAFPEPRAEIKTSRPFTGRVASGRGRVIEAHDGDYSIEATQNPLTAQETAIAQKNGFDVISDDGQAVALMAGDKRTVREHGDINWVARSLTGEGAGRGR